jgi:AcrR family transcriptional regulator
MATRDEKKLQTRQALLQAALTLTSQGRSFASLGLREVTREAGVVPTAFYRHFRDLDELGLALVDDVCLTLRQLMRDARLNAGGGDVAIQSSVRSFLHYVKEHSKAFEFLARERFGGPPVVRKAILREIHYFIGELASDLRVFPAFYSMPSQDLEMISDLVVNTVINLIVDILDLLAGQSAREEELIVRTIKQLRLIFLGALTWRADRGAVTAPLQSPGAAGS